MTKLKLTSTWTQLTTPCTLQVVSGGRVAVCVGEVPSTNTPYFILNPFDIWNHTNDSLLYLRTVESDYTSDITYTLL